MKNFLRSAVIAVTLSLSVVSPTGAADVTAIVGVNVAPMDAERVLANHTVIIEGDRITAMGPRDETPTPDGADIIDGDGRYLIPGLAEMHGHLPSGGANAEDTLFLYVAGGVTLVRGMQGNEAQFALRERVDAGEIVGPTLYLAAPSINGNNTKSPDEAREKVRGYKEAGWDLLKTHEGLSRETYDAMADEANKVGIEFAGHVADDAGLARALEAGQRTIEHLDNYLTFMGAEDQPVSDEMLAQAVKATKDAGAGVVATLALWETFLGLPEDPAAMPEVRYAPAQTRAAWASQLASVRANVAAEGGGALVIENRRKTLKALSDGGAEILLGSDAPQLYSVPGFSIHREMDAMAVAGMSPYEILRSGTAAIGAYYADKDTSGVIAPGARADLILLDANPLEDIANAALIDGVMLRGRWLPKAEIDARLEEIAAKNN